MHLALALLVACCVGLSCGDAPPSWIEDQVALMQHRTHASAQQSNAQEPAASNPITAAAQLGPATIGGAPVCYMAGQHASDCIAQNLRPGSTTYIAPGGLTSCIDSSQPYMFRVTMGNPSKVVFWLQDGGACFDRQTTVLQPKCRTGIEAVADEGIFDRSNPDNPYADWTSIAILYCSGDAHSGDLTTTYLDSNNERVTVKQVGFLNVMSVIDWVKQGLPPLQSVVLTGSSAGSLGVQVLASYILDSLPIVGNAAVVADSWLQIPIPDEPPGMFFVKFQTCWKVPIFSALPASLQRKCMAGKLTATDMFLAAMQAKPDVLFTAINTKTDAVQIEYYILLTWVLKGIVIDLSSQEKYAQLAGIYTRFMNQELELLNTQKNFVSYVLDGSEHTFLHHPRFFSASLPEIEGCTRASDVQCPLSGAFCSGNSCCPRVDGLVGSQTFPCPTAAKTYAGCEHDAKVYDCLSPRPSLRQWIGSFPPVPRSEIGSHCHGDLLLAADWANAEVFQGTLYCSAGQAGKTFVASR